MPRPHMPLHIVGVGHICPAGKCHRAATNTTPDALGDLVKPISTKRGTPKTPSDPITPDREDQE